MTRPPSRVIVGVAEHPAALRALHFAVTEARRRGSTLIAARIWSLPVTWPPSVMELITQDDLAQEASETVRRAFVAALGAPAPDVSVNVMTTHGAPGPELVRLADRDDDLLVVGSRQRTLIGRAIHGSTTQYCVTHANCPVVVVPYALARAGTKRASSRQLQRELRRLVDAA